MCVGLDRAPVTAPEESGAFPPTSGAEDNKRSGDPPNHSSGRKVHCCSVAMTRAAPAFRIQLAQSRVILSLGPRTYHDLALAAAGAKLGESPAPCHVRGSSASEMMPSSPTTLASAYVRRSSMRPLGSRWALGSSGPV